jgi:hypothetical protein
MHNEGPGPRPGFGAAGKCPTWHGFCSSPHGKRRFTPEEKLMAQTSDGPESVAERANELYWSSSLTVDDIVADLGISRSGLYASIEPVPAGLVCADCQERMLHGNRTMRDRGIAACPSCGRESAPGESVAEEGGEVRGRRTGAPGDYAEDVSAALARAPGRGQSFGREGGAHGEDEEHDESHAAEPFARWSDALRAVTPQRLALVGGAAALGIVAGAAMTRLLHD